MNKRNISILAGTVSTVLLGFWILDRFFYVDRMVSKGALTRRGAEGEVYELTLHGPQFRDQHLARLRHLTELKNLSLSESSVSSQGLQDVSKLSQLKSLNLSGMTLTDSDLGAIARMPNLNSLIMRKSKITDEGLKRLAKSKSLGSLNLDFSKGVTPKGLKYLKQCKSLNSVSILDIEIDYSTYLDIVEHTPSVNFQVDESIILERGAPEPLLLKWRTDNLRELDLSLKRPTNQEAHEQITKELLQRVQWKENIVSFKIHRPSLLSADAISALPEFTSLTQLSLHIDPAGISELEKIHPLTRLQQLYLSYGESDKSQSVNLDFLENLSDLQHLSLSGTQLELRNLSSLIRLKKLTRLALINCGLGDEIVPILKQMPQIKTVDLYGNHLTVASLDQLKTLPYLEGAELRGNDISQSRLDEFRKSLQDK